MFDVWVMTTETVATLATFKNPRRDIFFVDILSSSFSFRPVKAGTFVSAAVASIASAAENFISRSLWN